MKKIILFLFLAVFAFSQEKAPSFSIVIGSEEYSVRATGSMKPTFNENYLLWVKKLNFKDIRVGDIILFELKEPLIIQGQLPIYIICHRVIRKSSNGSIILTKGDNNQSEDGFLIDESMYRGTVIAIVRKENLDTEDGK